MPDSLVRHWHVELHGSLSDLAKKFLVSQESMRIRLDTLGLRAAEVV
jgi:hypothetical protein